MHQLWLASSGTSVGTANVSATALRFFFKITLKRHDLAEELISTREPRRLPVVLSPEEVGRLLAAATNTKHRAILSLAYATGLRSSEVVSLKLTDIDRDRMLIRVEQGKGKKDRYVILSPILLAILHEWWRVARKKGWMSPGQPWLFPGYRGQHTSARQLHRIVRLAAGRAGITKRVGVHTLRHCFATHLLEQKTDIRHLLDIALHLGALVIDRPQHGEAPRRHQRQRGHKRQHREAGRNTQAMAALEYLHERSALRRPYSLDRTRGYRRGSTTRPARRVICGHRARS